ncbi:hypothetical protein I546_5780 [Mycobacterium kansasii 732]|uniref:Uncharacterized protein n=1 Tax=Mycobacterium kansasii 662 TaxID=1299326 RepID=X7Z075_MYCKA|nr:hypothetical protein [Mycobacterium pseudokansasii]EUA06078.1 hypothetical protein I546_5780 [Mycobacterium kansasii 732]EUA12436.1 hypothetical protein I545_5153 [Mycobacterium kansasii 662]VBA33985.1 hypothetical protein LAUMK35_05629 [Mycobacterium pseudokansasii]VBA35466.1 hypothetical protein LAUMK21_05589 [Mycobacterium pseudokansasii]
MTPGADDGSARPGIRNAGLWTTRNREIWRETNKSAQAQESRPDYPRQGSRVDEPDIDTAERDDISAYDGGTHRRP